MVKCSSNDFEKIAGFYKYVIDNTADMKFNCRWVYGQHPSDEMIKSYIEDGYMYYAENEGEISAAVAVTPFQTEAYHSVEWQLDLPDDRVNVIHLLAVNPEKQKAGIAKEVMTEIIADSRKNGQKAVRLDALGTNKPAQKLYESIGFTKVGVQKLYAECTGWTDFILYELAL